MVNGKLPLIPQQRRKSRYPRIVAMGQQRHPSTRVYNFNPCFEANSSTLRLISGISRSTWAR